MPGVSRAPYQPMPKPSPLVVSTPNRECLLCTTSEFSDLKSNSSRSTGEPEYASQRHISTSSGLQSTGEKVPPDHPLRMRFAAWPVATVRPAEGGTVRTITMLVLSPDDPATLVVPKLERPDAEASPGTGGLRLQALCNGRATAR